MDQSPFYHEPVMAEQVVDAFRDAAPGLLVDATFGGGGHTKALLAALPDRTVLALDRDPDAAAQVPDEPRLRFVPANFAHLGDVLAQHAGEPLDEHGEGPVDNHGVAGVLFDVGVSSHQLDEARRGFSYRRSGPLDMRMGPDADVTAADIVNDFPVDELRRILRRYGEERYAARIADAIVHRRPHTDTGGLAAVIADAVPAAARRKRHPARKVFQAIRIAVNEELAALAEGLEAAIRWTRPGGRIAVITYHSLEDRIVKRRFVAGASGCECPPDFPVCTCGRVAELRLLARKGLRPGEAEIARNPRARSARLRVAERVGGGAS
jgi:16S rRNA (cytosine1402-N4)-methyltransferase